MMSKKGEVTTAQRNGITEGVIWQQILIFFFPILFGTFFQQLYNTADAIIVGRFVGKEALSAVGGTTGTLINLLVGFFVGMSSGASVVVSQYYGAEQAENVKKSVHTAFCLAIGGGVVLMIIGQVFSPLAIRLMGAPVDIIDYSVTYLRIYFLGVIGNLVYNMGAAILRAVGDSKRPLYFLIAACLTNIVLDILFVVILRMEVAGAALATIMSQMMAAFLVLRTLMKTKESYRFEFKSLKLDKPIFRKVIKIGLPTGLQSMMYSISNIVIQAKLNTFGTNTIAAWAVFGKIDGIFWMAMDALSISITTFAGQNYGAGKIDRLKKGTYVGLGLTVAVTAILAGAVMNFGGPISSLFTDDAMVLDEAMRIILFQAPFWFCYACVNVFPSTLRGLGDTLVPMLIICFGTCVLRVIWIMTAGAMVPTLRTTLLSYPISWSITSIAFLIYYYRYSAMKKLA